MSSARSMMIYRAVVNRKVGGAADELGHPTVVDTEIHAALPVFVTPVSSDLKFNSNRVLDLGNIRGLAEHDADIKTGDRLIVSSRSGEVLYENLRVLGVELAPRSHKELMIQSVS